jgi:hypothetical protein
MTSNKHLVETDEEMWKDIKGYEGLYKISNYGRVESVARAAKNSKKGERPIRSRILKASLMSEYPAVILCKKGVKKTGLIHRLVAEAFAEKPKEYDCVNHINGIKTDNYYKNLEWVTYTQNNRHAIKTGLMRKAQGERSGAAKLKDNDVSKIRELLKNGHRSAALAKKYKVSSSCIWSIKTGKTWKHLIKESKGE